MFVVSSKPVVEWFSRAIGASDRAKRICASINVRGLVLAAACYRKVCVGSRIIELSEFVALWRYRCSRARDGKQGHVKLAERFSFLSDKLWFCCSVYSFVSLKAVFLFLCVVLVALFNKAWI